MKLTLALLLLAALAACSSAQTQQYMQQDWNATTKEVMSGLDVGNVMGNGRLQVAVSGSADGLVYLYDHKGNLLWERNVASYINTVAVGDVMGTGKAQVIEGHADMYVYDGNGVRLLSWNSQDPVYRIKTGDLDGDGVADIIYASYGKDTCKDSLVSAIDARNKTKLWQYTVGKDMPSVIEYGDFMGDGRKEVLVGTIYRSKGSSKATGCDKNVDKPATLTMLSSEGQVKWQYTTDGGVTSLAVGDINGDGKMEIGVGSLTLVILDSSGQPLWRNNDYVTSYVDSIVFADLDGSNKSKVIAASNEVHVFDNAGVHLWTGLTDSRTYKLLAADLDGDGKPEVIAGSGSLYVFDANGKQLWRSPSHTSYGLLKSADLTGTKSNEIIAGSVKQVVAYKTQPIARQMLADRLLAQALARPASQVDVALDELRQAQDIYRQLGLTDKVSDCVNEITRLSSTSGRVGDLRTEADVAYNLSLSFRARGDYVNATRYAQIALSKYQSPQVNDRYSIEQCRSIINASSSILAYNASQEIILAYDSYRSKDYQASMQHALTAEQYFKVIGDPRWENASVLVSELRVIVGPQNTTSQGLKLPDINALSAKLRSLKPIYVVAAVAAVVALFILIMVTIFFWRLGSRKTLDPNKLHKVRYGEPDTVEPDWIASKTKAKESAETLQINGFSRLRNLTVEKYTVSDENPATLQVHETQEVSVKTPASMRMAHVQRYAPASDILQEPTTDPVISHEVKFHEEDVEPQTRVASRLPPVNAASERSIRSRRERLMGKATAKDEVRVELSPNKGIFKAKVCRNGACLKTGKLGARRIR